MSGNHKDHEGDLWISCLSSCVAFIVALAIVAGLVWLAAIWINHLFG